MKQKTIGLCQINAGFSGHFYLPYSVGLLEAYARKNLKNLERYNWLLPVYKREPVGEAVRKLIESDIVGISLYVWNFQLSLAIARELKARKPEIVIVVGGPHVPNPPDEKRKKPDLSEIFMNEHPYLDIAVHGEGEKVFSKLLENLDELSGVPSISYRAGGRVLHNERAPRISDLDSVPSPYLEGTFDRLMAAHPGSKWIVVWETDRGCPFSCSFCDWGSATASRVNLWEDVRVFAEIDWFGKHKVEFIFLANANFGIKARDVSIAKYCSDMKARIGYPLAITVSNTKNAQERSFEIQKIFAESGLNTGATVSMQSLNSQVLKEIKRDNIKIEGSQGFQGLQRKFKGVGIQAYTDLILCLPGETYDSFASGVNRLITNGQHDRILFYNLTILPNAEMGDPAYQARYGMELVTSGIINIHGRKSEDEWDVPETQKLVVATNTMSREDWIRTRVFSWMTQFLHFDKVLQMPLVLTHELTQATYRELIEFFSEGKFGEVSDFPTLTYVRNFFLAKARDIQGGGAEFCHSAEWLDIWWPTDEYMVIDLAVTGKFHSFYEEIGKALASFIEVRGFRRYVPVIRRSVELNEEMFKRPFVGGNSTVELSWNIWEFYQAAIRDEPISLREARSVMVIDRNGEQWNSWEDWFKKVVWWSSKRGAYLYNGTVSEEFLSGHF